MNIEEALKEGLIKHEESGKTVILAIESQYLLATERIADFLRSLRKHFKIEAWFSSDCFQPIQQLEALPDETIKPDFRKYFTRAHDQDAFMLYGLKRSSPEESGKKGRCGRNSKYG